MSRPRRMSNAEENEILEEARHLLSFGLGFDRVGRTLGVGRDWLMRRLVIGYTEKCRQSVRSSAAFSLGPTHRVLPEARLTAAEVLARIPPDTRDLTGRLLGDPLPGRSALDKRAGRAQHGTHPNR